MAQWEEVGECSFFSMKGFKMSPVQKRVLWGVAILILLLFGCRVLPAMLEAMTAAIEAFDWAGAGRATGEFMVTWGKAVVTWFMPVIMWVLDKF